MWNRRENPLRPAGKGDKRSPQTCPMFLLGFPAAGGHHRGSPPCHAWLVPNSGHVPSGNGKGEDRRRLFPLLPGRPRRGRRCCRPAPACREPQGPAGTAALLPLSSPARVASGGMAVPVVWQLPNPGGWFREIANATLVPRFPPALQLVQPSVLTTEPAPNFCKQ